MHTNQFNKQLIIVINSITQEFQLKIKQFYLIFQLSHIIKFFNIFQMINLKKITSLLQKYHIKQQIINTTLLSGLSNQSYVLHFQSSPPLVIKFYKNLFPMFVDHQFQYQIVHKLQLNKEYPKIYDHTNQFRIQSFIQGIPLQGQDINIKILRSIIQNLANFSVKYNDKNLKRRQFNYLVDNFKEIYVKISNKHGQKIKQSVNYIEQMLKEDTLKKVVQILPESMILSHNDTNLTNYLIKYGEVQGQFQLMLLDYEFACLNYVGFDIGNLFNEIATQYSCIFQIRQQWQISEQMKQELIQIYFNKIDGQGLIDKNTRRRLTNIGRLLSHQFWFFIGLLSFEDEKCDLDLNYYLKRRNQQFKKYLNLVRIQ